jgi:hypothetical protein
MEGPEQGDHIQHAPRGLGRADRHLAALKAGQGIELHTGLFDTSEDPAGVADEQLARPRDAHTTTRALKQTRIQLRLQSLNLMAQRGLTRETPPRPA